MVIRHSALFIAFMFALNVRAHAQVAISPLPNTIESLDLTLMNADSVVIATLAEIYPDPSGRGINPELTIAVRETLKGAVRERVRITIGIVREFPSIKKNTDVLLVAIPANARSAATVWNLSRSGLAVMTADLRLLKTPTSVLDSAREILRGAGGAKPVPMLDVPLKAARVAGTKLEDFPKYGPKEDFVLLKVPINERLERLAQEEARSVDPYLRAHGASALQYFKSDANIALLKSLLDDPAWEVQKNGRSYKGPLRIECNEVPGAAAAALKMLAVDVPKTDRCRPVNPEVLVVSLALDAKPVSAADIENLSRYLNLETLYLSTQQLTDAQWESIGKLRSLKVLVLAGSNISDSSLRRLADLPKLTHLDLGNTAVTDAGVLELAKFKSLKRVDLRRKGTSAGVAALKRKRPDIDVRLEEQ